MSTPRRHWDSFFSSETDWFDWKNVILKGFLLLKRLLHAHSRNLMVLTRDDICRGEFDTKLPAENKLELTKDCLRIRLEPSGLFGAYFTRPNPKVHVSAADLSLLLPHKTLPEEAKMIYNQHYLHDFILAHDAGSE